jgi:hypothetical protein
MTESEEISNIRISSEANTFIRIIESSVPFALNDDLDLELNESQLEFIKNHHLALPKNTTLLLVSLDQLVDNFTIDKKSTLDNSIKTLCEGLHLTDDDREYIIKKLVEKLMK